MLRIPLLWMLLLVGLVLPAEGQTLAEIDRMRDAGRFTQALTALEQMHRKAPTDVDVLWRMSRTRVDIGEKMPEGAAQATQYNAAMTDAAAAVKAGPNNAEAYLAMAIAAGRVGLISGTRRKVELSREVKQNVDRALSLDPKLGIAYHVRGRWNFEVASLGFMERAVVKMVYGGLPNASYEQAAADFRRAIQFDDKVINRLELGRTYLKLGDKAKARVELNRAVSMPESDPDDAAHKAEARKLLAKAG